MSQYRITSEGAKQIISNYFAIYCYFLSFGERIYPEWPKLLPFRNNKRWYVFCGVFRSDCGDFYRFNFLKAQNNKNHKFLEVTNFANWKNKGRNIWSFRLPVGVRNRKIRQLTEVFGRTGVSPLHSQKRLAPKTQL